MAQSKKDQARIASEMNQVFDILANNPQGVTVNTIMSHVGISKDRAWAHIRRLRDVFSKDPETIVCDPQGPREQWLYSIASTYEQTRGWTTFRTTHLETQLRTLVNVAASVLHMVPANTVQGKKALKIHRTLEYLEKELAEIAA